MNGVISPCNSGRVWACYDMIIVFKRGRARWTFVWEISIVSVCDMTGWADGVEVLDNSGSYICVFLDDLFICFPVDALKC